MSNGIRAILRTDKGCIWQVDDELARLRDKVATAYLAQRGDSFCHAGVALPLDKQTLGVTIDNNVIGGLLQEYGAKMGRHNARLMLGFMLDGNALSPMGISLLDDMNRAFCNLIRGMLDNGQDPIAELDKMARGALQ